MNWPAIIRETELKVLELFDMGLLDGTTHTCIGQERMATRVIENLRKTDTVLSNHRNHGHYIARTHDVRGLLAELMGLPSGVCGGFGGSQHIHDPGRRFFASGVQGGLVPIAAGIAMANKREGNGDIAVCFVGDGTFGQGVLYETIGAICLWSLPVLLVVENNRYAQSTPIEDHLGAVDIMNILSAYGNRLKISRIDEEKATDAEREYISSSMINRVRLCQPGAILVDTVRLGPHSKGDDYRDKAYLDSITELDWYRQIGGQEKEQARAYVDKIAKELLNEVRGIY